MRVEASRGRLLERTFEHAILDPTCFALVCCRDPHGSLALVAFRTGAGRTSWTGTVAALSGQFAAALRQRASVHQLPLDLGLQQPLVSLALVHRQQQQVSALQQLPLDLVHQV